MLKTERIISKEKMITFLARGIKPDLFSDTTKTIYLPPGLNDDAINNMISFRIDKAEKEEVIKIINKSHTGTCIFAGEKTVLVIPPFPIRESVVFQGYEPSELIEILTSKLMIGVILIRLGSFALGVCKGQELLDSKVGTGLIHSRHRQGGSSARRFQRHREKQIEAFLTRVCEHFNVHISPYTDMLDYAVYGGAWTTIDLFKKHCRMTDRLENRLLTSLLDIPEPRLHVLEAAIKRIWSCRVVEWQNEITAGIKVNKIGDC